MKLTIFAIAAVLLCSLMMSAEAGRPRSRPRVIRIRIIRIIPIRRGRRDVSDTAAPLPSTDDYNAIGNGKLITTNDPDTLICRHNATDGDVTHEEITRLCDSVRQQIKQTTGEDVDFEVEVQSLVGQSLNRK